MTLLSVGRAQGTFYVIENGVLKEKVRDNTGVDFRNMKLPLGKLYRMAYRQPYYYGHTFLPLGESQFSIQDKAIGYRFEEVKFDPTAF